LVASPPLPIDDVPAGTYRVDMSSPQIDLTTQGSWHRGAYRPSERHLIILDRDSTKTEFVITNGVFRGSTPQEALDGMCPAGAIAFGAPVTTTLLGNSAVQNEGAVTSECTWASSGNVDMTLPVGNTVRAVAADVNGSVIVVVADTGTDNWPAFASEVDALLASMTIAV
jgi:hypothetical protein